MTKEQLLNSIRAIENKVVSLRKIVSRMKQDFIAKGSIREICSSIAKAWFEQIEPSLNSFSIDEGSIKKYHESFTALLNLGLSKNIRKDSIVKISDKIMEDFKKDIVIPIIKKSSVGMDVNNLYPMLEHVTEAESEYLKEALDCASHQFLRDSVVLGWAAAISRIHTVIARNVGIEKFNEATKKMSAINEGRYKRYNSKYCLQSANELRTVFDSHLLWILEYLQFIDPNQHDRLEVNFTIRNNCAHPGDAPVKEPNIIAFFTDLNEIIFLNPKFNIVDNL